MDSDSSIDQLFREDIAAYAACERRFPVVDSLVLAVLQPRPAAVRRGAPGRDPAAAQDGAPDGAQQGADGSAGQGGPKVAGKLQGERELTGGRVQDGAYVVKLLDLFDVSELDADRTVLHKLFDIFYAMRRCRRHEKKETELTDVGAFGYNPGLIREMDFRTELEGDGGFHEVRGHQSPRNGQAEADTDVAGHGVAGGPNHGSERGGARPHELPDPGD
ncbi:unnamed protein product [Phytophthora lilii]|uniref:Unnamed protein product n=1 Tax=Phytophthora lilii TaxID=2077276 RepID=A0A9W6WQK0_9STRA|nr:unnamed protein product [Phytophthora lilii]